MWRQLLVYPFVALLAVLLGLNSVPPENESNGNDPPANSGDGGPYIDPDGLIYPHPRS